MSLGQLAPHFGGLSVKPQHLDLGHNFLLVEFAGQRQFAVEQFEGPVEPGDLLVEHVDILRHLLGTHVEHAGLGRNRGRHHLVQLVGEGDLASSSGFGLKPGHARNHCRPPLPDFAEL